MNKIIRGLSLVVCSFAILGLAACSSDTISDAFDLNENQVLITPPDDDQAVITPPGGDDSGCGDSPGQIPDQVQNAWRGDPIAHIRVYCFAACMPGQNRTANCGTLRQFVKHNPDLGSAEQLCTYC